MTQYIDKAALVAEIEKYYNECLKRSKITDSDYWNAKWNARADAYRNVLTILDDTIEVKEVDLDDSVTHYLLHKHTSPLSAIMHQADLKSEMQYHKDIENAYKAGFEFGLLTNNKEKSFDATVCKAGNTYLKEMDKDAIAKALESYKDGDKVKVIIIKNE